MMRALDEAGVVTDHPLEVAFFTEEEGVRFGTDMLGSAVAAGRIPLEEALARTDVDGVTVEAELERQGFRRHGSGADQGLRTPTSRPTSSRGRCSPRRATTSASSPASRRSAGRSSPCSARRRTPGTTPMELRHDAGLAMAMITTKLHEMVASRKYGDLRVTVGRADTYPNLINIVPARVVCTVDLRNPSEVHMETVEQELRDYFTFVTAQTGVDITAKQTAKTPLVTFHEEVEELIEEKIDAAGLTQSRILSGAGHDAGEIASLCPTAMIFVPGEYDGISHNPREYSTPEACTNGVQALTDVVVSLSTAGTID